MQQARDLAGGNLTKHFQIIFMVNYNKTKQSPFIIDTNTIIINKIKASQMKRTIIISLHLAMEMIP